MRTIEFTESELSEIISFYQQERDKSLQKIAEIERILSLLQPAQATPATDTPLSPVKGRRNARKADPSPAAPSPGAFPAAESGNGSAKVAERKKRKTAAKPRTKPQKAREEEGDPEENGMYVTGSVTHLNGKWVRFITDLLEKQGRVIAADDIVSEAIYRYDIADEKHQTTRQVIYNTLYKLDSSKRMIGSCTIPGRKGKRYGLKKWFTPDGEIKETFLAKAT
ncbi:MAG: hypothetical protein ICV83_10275 [Cytophagales bacterium]|nr:hypothetical protein [Cytophagales bacterium]